MYKEFKFGDVVINHLASNENPQKIGVFVKYLENKKLAEFTNTNGDFWLIHLDKNLKLELVKNIMA